jgi:hypothetical protein
MVDAQQPHNKFISATEIHSFSLSIQNLMFDLSSNIYSGTKKVTVHNIIHDPKESA